MAEQTHQTFEAAGEYLDTRALTERLGSAGELTTLSPAAYGHNLAKVHSVEDLREFLLRYREEILGPLEFRHIIEAAECAANNHLKELFALDKRLAREPRLKEFQLASRAVGKRQLNRMRAMKDLRVLQRYRDLVNDGKARGWHTLVYGLVLSAYSIPLRQGLLHYGRQTLGGFIDSAARPLRLTETSRAELRDEQVLSLPPAIGQTLAPDEDRGFRIV